MSLSEFTGLITLYQFAIRRDQTEKNPAVLLHEGRSVIYVARPLGHGAELTMRTYGHVIEELEDAPQRPLREATARARATIAG